MKQLFKKKKKLTRVWLKEIRLKAGLTMKMVATLSGISEGYYCHIENGIRNAPVKTAKRIAAALGFDWNLFYRE